MFKTIATITLSSACLLSSFNSYAVFPDYNGSPVIVQHLGKLEWPADVPIIEPSPFPSLTQLVSNDVNDLHGDLSCELIISTPGNYHMALKDAIYGEPDLNHVGLIEQTGTPSQFKVSICWSTSPPISIDQIMSEKLQFKNISMIGRPSLAMAPGNVMNTLIANGQVDGATRQTIFSNRGNVMIVRNDKFIAGPDQITNICDLARPDIRVVTPHPDKEPGSFGNFSGTIYNVAAQNNFVCNAQELYDSIFQWKPTSIDLTKYDNPYNIDDVKSVFGRGPTPQGTGAKWVASSRIMHRDIPYALCHDEADAGIIFYHQALYMKETMAVTGCDLDIIPLGGTVADPQPLAGNKVGAIHIAKVNGSYAKKVNDTRNDIYDFLTTSPIWEQILIKHGMVR